MEDPDFEPKPIAWLILLDSQGKLFGIQDNRILPSKEKRRSSKSVPAPISRTMMVPREKGRTCNTYAFLLFDKAEYVFGIDPDGKRSQVSLKERFHAFYHKTLACYQATQDEGVEAVLKFLERVKVGYRVELPAECKSNDLFGFIYLPDNDEALVTDRPAVVRYWTSIRQREKEQTRGRGNTQDDEQECTCRCLITGKPCVPVDKHPRIMGIPGATSGAPLVSFNQKAFNSYGWKDNVNATISREAAEACGTALNRLLSRSWPKPGCPGKFLPKWSLSMSSDLAVCYWSDNKAACADDFLSQLGDIVEGHEEKVAEPFRSLWRGVAPVWEKPGNIHVLILSSVQGRMAIRDYFYMPTGQMLKNIAQHFSDIEVVRNTPQPAKGLPPVMGLSLLLESFSFLREQSQQNDKKNPTPLEISIVRSIFQGDAYPMSMLPRALLRLRAEFCRDDWINLQRRDACVAWIKAVLSRNPRLGNDSLKQEVSKEMNWEQEDRSYWYGCLLAVIEKAQALAVGNISATIIDKHFGAASATPMRAFGQLLRKMRNDMNRAKNGKHAAATGRLEKVADEVVSRVDAFEMTLDLEHQCLFVLGYHHMRHWLWENLFAQQENWDPLWQEVTTQPLAVGLAPTFLPDVEEGTMELVTSVAAS